MCCTGNMLQYNMQQVRIKYNIITSVQVVNSSRNTVAWPRYIPGDVLLCCLAVAGLNNSAAWRQDATHVFIVGIHMPRQNDVYVMLCDNFIVV